MNGEPPADADAAVAALGHELRIQRALVAIGDAANRADDLAAFYPIVHGILKTLTYAENCYVALYDDEHRSINFPYYVDTVDTDIPDPTVWEPFGVGDARGVTAYLLRTGVPQLVTPERSDELQAAGEIVGLGLMADGDWLGVPLIVEGRTIGVLAVQTYTPDKRYTQADVDLMAIVGGHVGAALARVRALEEARQRTAELTLVNEIGRGLAQELEFDAIVELVGERVRDQFGATSMFIALYDAETTMLAFPYELNEGQRVSTPPFTLGPGLTSEVIRRKAPLRLGTAEEVQAAGAIASGVDALSWLGVPILVGEDVLGVIALESPHTNAFADSTERLLATVAASMGVALKNARLFDQTKRRPMVLPVVMEV